MSQRSWKDEGNESHYEFPEKYENAVIRSVNMYSVKAHIVDAPDFEIMVKR